MIGCYLIGEPGVGKTTLMDGLLAPFDRMPHEHLTKRLYAEPLLLDTRRVGWHLGRARALFGGTDALNMAVHPEAVQWAAASADGLVFGEGQRLATLGFIAALAARGPTLVIHVYGPDFARRMRRARGTVQNEAWAKASQSRARNLARNLHGVEGVKLATVQAGPDALRTVQHLWAVFASQEATDAH